MPTDLLNNIARLKSRLKGKVLTPEDADFTEAVAVWNKAITKQPQLMVMPENKEDIIETVQFARQHNLPLSVKGGGHDWAGRSVGEGGIQMNLRRMNRVNINPAEKTAVVQGGATSMEVIQAAEPHQLLPVTGTHDTVGFAGIALGGGYGPLSPALGLVVDSIIGAEIVLSDGTFCQVDAQNHPDLFWAIHGGGGNFGVVVSLTIRLHDAEPILTGTLLFQEADAVKVLQGFSDIMKKAPDHLGADSGVMHIPDGKVVVYLIPFWYGESFAEGEKHIEALKQLAIPVQADVRVTSYREMTATSSDNQRKSAPCYAIQTRSLPALDEASIRSIVTAVKNAPSPFSIVHIHNLHGRPTRMAADETPFPVRQFHFMVEIIASWNPDDKNPGQHQAWATALSEALKPTALPGGYANILGPDESEQVAHVFGDNLQRMKEVKSQYDPAGMFHGIAAFNQ